MTVYFGENLKKLRKEKDITQESLADYLGVSFQAVSKWERGDTYPDITVLPEIAAFFNVSTDDLLGIYSIKRQKQKQEILDFYSKMKFKDSSQTFEKLAQAKKDFPEDFSILVRYMEMLMHEKTDKDNPEFSEASAEIQSIYEKIRDFCTDDRIRMWAKRLACQHLHTKAYYTQEEKYQKEAEKILDEMPKMIDTREYLSTMLVDGELHYTACSDALEQLLYMLQNVASHHCYYDSRFSPDYKIEAINKMLTVFDLFFPDGEYGKLWLHVIYDYGNLGRAYFEKGDTENAVANLKKSAELAKKYDERLETVVMTVQFFEGKSTEKTLRGKTMCERMKTLMTEKYPLSDEFKSSPGFLSIIEYLG